MSKITVVAFVQNRSEQAGQAGQPNRVIRLQHVRESVDNAKLFDPATPGSVSLDATGLSAEALAAFNGGATVTITIDTGS